MTKAEQKNIDAVYGYVVAMNNYLTDYRGRISLEDREVLYNYLREIIAIIKGYKK